MNSENLRRVADAIEKHEFKNLGFNMSDWVEVDENEDKSGYNCGTTACVAGWAAMLAEGFTTEQDLLELPNVPDVAGTYLDLTGMQREKLFMYHSHLGGNAQISVAEAVATLRYAADHGIVDWDAANPVKDSAP